MTKQDLIVNKKVSQFRELSHLPDNTPIDVHNLLLQLNVFTIFKPLSDNFSGMAFKLKNIKSILVNSNHSIGRQNFTIGHELYHLFMQEDFTPHKCNTGHNYNDKEEKNADLFSSKLLMPYEGIIDYISEEELSKNKIKTPTILKLEQIFEVSHLALLYRLKDLNLIDQNFIAENKSGINQTAKIFGFDTTLYKNGNKNNIIGDYGTYVNQAFNDEKISEGHLSELMDIYNYGKEEN